MNRTQTNWKKHTRKIKFDQHKYMTRKLKNKIGSLYTIAGEALYLADEYSGGESETANELCSQFEKVQNEIDELLEAKIKREKELLTALQDIAAMVVSPNDTRADILNRALKVIGKE